jgi:hypothetical protein
MRAYLHQLRLVRSEAEATSALHFPGQGTAPFFVSKALVPTARAGCAMNWSRGRTPTHGTRKGVCSDQVRVLGTVPDPFDEGANVGAPRPVGSGTRSECLILLRIPNAAATPVSCKCPSRQRASGSRLPRSLCRSRSTRSRVAVPKAGRRIDQTAPLLAGEGSSEAGACFLGRRGAGSRATRGGGLKWALALGLGIR